MYYIHWPEKVNMFLSFEELWYNVYVFKKDEDKDILDFLLSKDHDRINKEDLNEYYKSQINDEYTIIVYSNLNLKDVLKEIRKQKLEKLNNLNDKQ